MFLTSEGSSCKNLQPSDVSPGTVRVAVSPGSTSRVEAKVEGRVEVRSSRIWHIFVIL